MIDDEDDFDGDTDLEFDMAKRECSWAGVGTELFRCASRILQALAECAEQISLDLAGIHNRAIDAKEFFREAGRELETLTKEP